MDEVVIGLMRKDFPNASDWNVDGDKVEILDAGGAVIATIDTDKLTKYWNIAESAA